ncbi:MAG TPA: hemin uptake protein HemP [Pseudolabrys sp.]|nr:hemin uptake protein HemP [Pseudolabrys sp.]
MNDKDPKEQDKNTVAGRSVAVPARSIALLDNRIDSGELFAGTREIIIAHRDDLYRLRLTAQNKLILTK